MHVLIVSCVFPPEPVVSSQTSSQVAEALAERGHQVTVLAPFPSRPSGQLYKGYRRWLLRRETENKNIELVRCFSFLSRESRLFSRLLENISFGLMSGMRALTVHRPDVIYANTWPIIASGILLLVARLRRIPVVMSIQDVYPESLISQKRVRAIGWLARWLRRLDGLIASHSQALILLSKSFAALYTCERGISPQRTHVIPNWIDSKAVVIDAIGAREFRASYNIPDNAVLALYGGNIGTAAGVDTLIESFKTLRDVENLYLLVAGEGSNLSHCQNLARQVGCPRIMFHTPWPAEETSAVLNAADVFLLPTKGRQSDASVPSKLLTYLLAARPVIAMATRHSELARLMERSGAGWTIEPDQPEILAAKLRQVAEMALTERLRRGQEGQEFVLQNLTREVCLPNVIEVLENVATDDRARILNTTYGDL